MLKSQHPVATFHVGKRTNVLQAHKFLTDVFLRTSEQTARGAGTITPTLLSHLGEFFAAHPSCGACLLCVYCTADAELAESGASLTAAGQGASRLGTR